MFSPLLRFSLVGLVGLAFAVAAAPGCSLTGPFYYSLDNSTVITFGQVQNGSTYVGTCTPQSTCGWAYVTAVVDTVYPSWGRLQLAFDNGLISAGWLLGSTCADNVIYFGGQALYSAQWCRVGNTNCTAPFDTAWTGGIVHILEVSHSDIGWLGEQDDMLVDAANINASLDMMAVDPTFKWQHECIVRSRVAG